MPTLKIRNMNRTIAQREHALSDAVDCLQEQRLTQLEQLVFAAEQRVNDLDLPNDVIEDIASRYALIHAKRREQQEKASTQYMKNAALVEALEQELDMYLEIIEEIERQDRVRHADIDALANSVELNPQPEEITLAYAPLSKPGRLFRHSRDMATIVYDNADNFNLYTAIEEISRACGKFEDSSYFNHGVTIRAPRCLARTVFASYNTSAKRHGVKLEWYP